jgi:uncharacterized membrane protein
MKASRLSVFNYALVALAGACSLVFYTRLPDQVPTHWHLSGQPDGYTSKPFGPFVLPLVMAAIAVLASAAPRVSPASHSMASFASVFRLVRSAALLFLLTIHVSAVAFALGAGVPMSRVAAVAFGAFAAVVGNYAGKLTTNFFVGFRSPWTLSDSDVWYRTHRFGGKALVAAGVFSIVAGVMNRGIGVALVAVVVAAVAPYPYSFFLWRKARDKLPHP